MHIRQPLQRLSLRATNHILSKSGRGAELIHPVEPARTRFAPSPTGQLHLGSLRTALYNYLLARSTNGQFLLRLEDTDQNRLVPGAEESIYSALKWAGITWDEGPLVGGPYGPYRQSERGEIYQKYANKLLESGHAYRCFCPKHRLDALKESARKLSPPSMASYDRHCLSLTSEEVAQNIQSGQQHTIRFKSPEKFPEFYDLLHGKLNLQTQVNFQDVRYDDQVLIKSDGLPTYHLANVVDDHLMKITHVVRGEEWLPSTPKHIAMYAAFGWTPPKFVHIPLLTSASDKKLSKRRNDASVQYYKDEQATLPEALVNFVALLGWSPPRVNHESRSEVLSLAEMEKVFTIEGLTKGNAKLDLKKLDFFNKQHFHRRLEDPKLFDKIVDDCHDTLISKVGPVSQNKAYTRNVLLTLKSAVSSVEDFVSVATFAYRRPEYSTPQASKFVNKKTLDLLKQAQNSAFTKEMFGPLRFALAGGVPGVGIPLVEKILGDEEVSYRIQSAIDYLENNPNCK